MKSAPVFLASFLVLAGAVASAAQTRLPYQGGDVRIEPVERYDTSFDNYLSGLER